ncbi:MAG: HD domain-containing protein [Desulfobacteraceae bacterium]|jgi:tRNA nucleotidyltransferase/poly(A) polymerase
MRNPSTKIPAIVNSFLDQLKRETNLCATLRDLLLMPDMGSASICACGGMIRDTAISVISGANISSADFDFVCEGFTVDRMHQVLNGWAEKSALVKTVIHAGRSFPVWKVRVDGMDEMVDIALTRTEASFGDHHRDFHVNAEAVSVKEDSLRRDFTINAMYIRLFLNEAGDISGELLDFHGGLQDIEKRVVHCVGRSKDRLKEDPLRMLRAVRFAARFAGFSISETTADAIFDLAPELIQTISKERIGGELFKMLVANPEKALQDMERLRILPEIFPQLVPLTDVRLNRICSRIQLLAGQWNGQADSVQLFVALLFDLSMDALAEKMAVSMMAARMPAVFFSTDVVQHIAKQTRLGGVKNIAKLCNDTLVLLHYDFLENREAVLEQICSKYEDANELFQFYSIQKQISGAVGQDLQYLLDNLPKTTIDLNQLLLASGIPRGPHLQQIKLRLRQAEIDGTIVDAQDARVLLNRIYLEDTHLLQEHADKIKHHQKEMAEAHLPAKLRDEIRWLLFSKPVRLVTTYCENDVLDIVFPELADADKTVKLTAHHFSESFINDALLALSILYEENTSPTPVQILSLLFLDIGMVRTRGTGKDGHPTYYNHASVGAEMAYSVCNRLGIDPHISGDVYFVIRNHNALLTAGGPNRYKKLIGTVDDGLLDDLLLVHRIDQLAKMEVRDGRRIDDGQLDHYRHIVKHRKVWVAQAQKREQVHRRIPIKPLLSGYDLQQNNPLWGCGIPEGAHLGKIKYNLEQLQIKGIITTTREALLAARNHIVLHHLCTRPDAYLENLRNQQLLDAILPELAALIGLEQTGPYHQEDAYTHTLNVICHLPADASTALRLAAVFHDIGKPVVRTYDQEKGIYHFYRHEQKSLEILEAVYQRFSWTDACFNQAKVNWLIANHIRIQMDWAALKNPYKTIEKLFLRDNRTGKALPVSYVYDLMRLRKADSVGADAADPAIKQQKEQDLKIFTKLLDETKRRLAENKAQALEDEHVGRIWNGNLVLKHFQVSGPEVGRLVQLGQNHVRSCLADDRVPSMEEIVSYLNEKM